MAQRYYLKATGGTCYDKNGITFPRKRIVDLQIALKLVYGAFDIKWVNQFGWDNQPEVMAFNLLDDNTTGNGLLYDLGLIIVDIW